MSTPLNCWQTTWKFALNRVGTDEDIAEFSVWFDGGSLEPGDAELVHIAGGAVTAWQDHQDQAHWGTNVTFQSCISTAYLTTGHIKAQQEVAATGGWVGTDTGPAMPWETSLATSLYTYTRGTFVPQGRRKRGRYYLPPMAASQLDGSNSGYFDHTKVTAMLTSQAAFLLAARETDVGVPVGVVSVFSRTDGVLRPVTEVTLDAKFDSQRRRQNRESVGFVGVAFP